MVLNPGDYVISSEDMPGWLVATEGSLTVALDVELTDALRKEGTARELVNRIQNLRKGSGFDVTDRIDTIIYAEGAFYDEISSALGSFSDYIAAQTLSRSVSLEKAVNKGTPTEWNDGEIGIQVTR